MIRRLDIFLWVDIEAHTGIEFYAVVGDFVVRAFHLEDNLLFLLGEEVEEDGFAKSLVAEFFVDGEMFNINKVVESPIGEDAYGFVAVVVGGDHEMKFVFVAIL